jgi:hypothetical protein
MTQRPTAAWWDQLPVHTGGDVIIGQVGSGARNVAVGKNITQAIYDVLGAPTPEDKQVIDQRFADVAAALQQAHADLNPAVAEMGQFQLKLLQGELTKTDEADTPSASVITQIGNWLLDNVPQIAEALTGLFTTPAVGKIVGKAGDAAVAWVRDRFGQGQPGD